MDSSGISVLIDTKKGQEKNKKVVLKEISKSVLKVIMMAKLEQILILDKELGDVYKDFEVKKSVVEDKPLIDDYYFINFRNINIKKS